MASPQNREEVLLALALEKPADKRPAFLDAVCEGDSGLRQRLDGMLAAQGQADVLTAATTPGVAVTTQFEVTEVEDEAVGQTLGRYKLLERIGEGGCGVVYVAEQMEPVRRRVALKVIKLGMDTKQVVARFEAERQALAMMDHPNIAKVFDAGTTETGRPFFVMELVRGIRITEYCDQNNLTTKERLDLFIKVCQAIQHAHQKGIIHRDIKPSNILVTLHDGVPVPKVIDFGIAKATEGRLTDATVYTQLHQFIGTPAYMSPEQAEMSGLDIDTRSDIYSLGVLLYELLAGSTPFDAKELVASGLDAMRKTIREKEPVRPSTRFATLKSEESTTTAKRRSTDTSKLLHQLKGDLDWIVMKCLEKDRTRRYETANGLAFDLKRHLDNEPVLARPPSAAYKFQKAFKRNKLVFTAGAAVATALVIGIGVSTWQTMRARRAEREQNRLREVAVGALAGEKEQRTQAQAERQRAQAMELTARQRAYASDMSVAKQALDGNNLGPAQDLLDRQRPQPNQIDLRDWEWRYLWQHCQSDSLYELCRQSNAISSLAVSPDGKWLSIGEHDHGRLSVWDLRTRREAARLPAGQEEVSSSFSPRGSLLAFSTATALGGTNWHWAVMLWDATTRQTVGQELPLDGRCRGMAFSADGRTLFTFSTDDRLTLWQVPEGIRLRAYPAPLQHGLDPPLGVAMSGDSRVAAYAAPDGWIRVLDLESGLELWRTKAADEFVTALAFSTDAKTLASGAGFAESTIRLWDVASGKALGLPIEGHRRWVGALVFWPDGRELGSAGADGAIRTWDVSDPRQVRLLGKPLLGHRTEIWRLVLLPDHVTLASGDQDGSVRLWDTTLGEARQDPVVLETPLAAWSFAPDSKSVVGLARDGRVMRWRGIDFKESETLLRVGTNGSHAKFSEDGQLLAMAPTNGNVQLWDVSRRTLLHEFASTTKSLNFGRLALLFLSNNDKALILDQGDTWHEWDLSSWKETRSWPAHVNAFEIAVTSDETTCAAISMRGTLSLRNLKTGQQTNEDLDITSVEDVAFSSDGKLLAVASASGLTKLWETATLRQIATLPRTTGMGVHSVTFSQDDRRLATGGNGTEAVKIWDLESRQQICSLGGRGSQFWVTAFSADRNVIGSINDTGVLHLWRAPSWEEINAAEGKQP